ncbi:MAG: glycosyltransferase family 39 protein [Anaerolineae bacterium]|nr:glycosyltransferase family 39 protein [Anaerolineae bacterium]
MARLPIANRQSLIANGLFVVILLAATFLRLYRLDEIPPGVTHDEADTGYFVEVAYRTGRLSQVETPYGYAYKPFTQYSAVPFMAFFGTNDLALRFHAAFWGLVLLLFTYLWTRRAFGEAVGLGSAAMVGVTFWTVFDSRFALNSPPSPALFTGAVYFLWLAMDDEEGKRRWWAWMLFTLMLAGSFYAYEAAGAAAMACVPFFVYLPFIDRARFRRHGAWLAGALIVAGLLVAPHVLDLSSWGRTNTLSGPIREAAQGNLKPLLNNAISTLGTFSFSGDSFVTYNLPYRPIFDPVVSVFFYGGILLCLWRWRRPAYAFLLMWAAFGILPSLLLGEWTSTLHSKAAETPILALPALGAVELGRFVAGRLGRRWGRVFAAACVVWLAVVAAFTGCDYFVRWGQSPEARAAYFHNLVSIADYLDDGDYSGDVALSSPFPDVPLDPFVADMRLHRDDVHVRWFDARWAVVFPDTEHGLFVLPPNTPLNPYFADRVDLRLVERVQLHPEDVDPTFDVFEWSPRAEFSNMLPEMSRVVGVGDQSRELPVSFAPSTGSGRGGVELLAYDLLTPEVAPGGTVALVTFWRVRDPGALEPVEPRHYGRAAALFVHVLDEEGQIVGQDDRLDAPAWDWRAGDAFAQIHQVQLDDGVMPGPYDLAAGIYDRHTMERLPVVVGGVEQDRVLLEKLKVPSE